LFSVLGAIIWLLAGFMHYRTQSGIRRTITILQVILLVVAIMNVLMVSISVENKQGLPFINKILSWTISGNITIVYNFWKALIILLNLLFRSIVDLYD